MGPPVQSSIHSSPIQPHPQPDPCPFFLPLSPHRNAFVTSYIIAQTTSMEPRGGAGGGRDGGGGGGTREGRGNDRYAQQLASRYRRQGHQRRRQVNDQSPGPLDHLLYRFDPLPAAPDPGRLDTKWTAPTGLHRHIALLSVFS